MVSHNIQTVMANHKLQVVITQLQIVIKKGDFFLQFVVVQFVKKAKMFW